MIKMIQLYQKGPGLAKLVSALAGLEGGLSNGCAAAGLEGLESYGTRPRVAMAEGRERIPSEIVSAIMTVVDVVSCDCSIHPPDGWCFSVVSHSFHIACHRQWTSTTNTIK